MRCTNWYAVVAKMAIKQKGHDKAIELFDDLYKKSNKLDENRNSLRIIKNIIVKEVEKRWKTKMQS